MVKKWLNNTIVPCFILHIACMRAFLKFLINIGLIALLIWLVVRFTTLDDKIVDFLTKWSSGTWTIITESTCTTPWGISIPNGSSVFAYQLANPDENWSCHEEERKCVDWTLKWSYEFSACNSSDWWVITDTWSNWSGNFTIAPTGNACTTPWWQTITHGNYIVSYESPSSCRFQRRMCVDWELLGKFQYNYCMVAYQWGYNWFEEVSLTDWSSYAQMQDFSNSVNDGSLTSPYANGSSNPASRHYAPVNYGWNVANVVLPNDYWNQNAKWNVAVVGTKTVNPLATNGVSQYTLPRNRNSNNYTRYDLTQKWCQSPWGTFVENGQYVIAYRNSTAAKWHSCEYERRNCLNGKLHWSFWFASCNFQWQKTYTYQTYQPQNQWYDKYYWTNNTIPTYSNRSCRTPRGTTVKDWDYIRAYKYSSAPWSDWCEWEIRTCHDWILDGSYSNQTCRLKQPTNNNCYWRNCGTWNNSCSLPRWWNISHGQSVVAYSNSYGQCRSETRTCSNWWLQGSYWYQYCQNNDYPNYPQNNACSLPRWWNISHGQSVIAYSYGYNWVCSSERRYCNNWSLNGSYSMQSCNYQSNSCALPRWWSIANGQSVLAYNNAYGVCSSERRYCTNWNLNWSYSQQYCQSQQSCSLPRWGSIQNGQSVEAFLNPGSPCTKEIRTCINWVLNGSYGYSSCTLTQNSCALPRWGSIQNGQSVTAYSSSSSPCYQETRYCSNWTLNWSYWYRTCSTVIGWTADTYGERSSAGRYDSVPDWEDTCHNDATAAFTCTAQDSRTCTDYRKVENDCCIAGRAKYEKRTVTCIQ